MRALALAMVLAASAAGCGGGAAKPARPARAVSNAPLPPDATPQPLDYGGGVRAALGHGAIAVVDLRNRVAVEPARMSINAEQELSGLRWSGWGGGEASAAGRVQTVICDPTCAQGRLERSTATLVLSRPRRCGGERFYAKASMTYREPSSGRTRAPAAYLRTPC